jgi:hypothetical protein
MMARCLSCFNHHGFGQAIMPRLAKSAEEFEWYQSR